MKTLLFCCMAFLMLGTKATVMPPSTAQPPSNYSAMDTPGVQESAPNEPSKQKRKRKGHFSGWGWLVLGLTALVIGGLAWLTVWIWPMVALCWGILIAAGMTCLAAVIAAMGFYLFSFSYETARTIALQEQQDARRMKVGDTLYVYASGNLVLRDKPAKTGTKITSVQYGSPVFVLALPKADNQYVAEQIGSFTLSDGWVKVKTAEGQVGYLFEGYLMPYPPHLESSEEGIYDAEWFYPSKFDGQRIPLLLTDMPGLVEHFKRQYQDGAVFEQQGFEGGITQLLFLPADKFTMQQALVLGRNLFFSTYDKNGNVTLRNTKGSYDTAKQILTIQITDGYEQFTLQNKDGRLVIEFNSAD